MRLLPHWTTYTDNLPPNVGGRAEFCFILILPKYRDDAGIHRHEYEHVKQFWLMWALFTLAVVAAVQLTGATENNYVLALFGAALHAAFHVWIKPYYGLRQRLTQSKQSWMALIWV